MATVNQSIEVDRPVSTVYNQWTQFEEFPSFMKGVESVTQTDDTHLHWVAEIGGKRHEWDAEITEQTPDQRVSWVSVDGHGTGGVVTFEAIGGDRTRVTVEMAHEAEGIVESVGSALGFDDRQVKGDLERFKEVIESRPAESGAWRGEVRGGETTSPASSDIDTGLGTTDSTTDTGLGTTAADTSATRTTDI